MALKWAGILVAVIALTLAVTANLLDTGKPLPAMVNFAVIVVAAVATVVAIVADLYVRIDTKINKLHATLVARFDRLDAETGDRNSGFVEGYLLGHPSDAAVVPMTPRTSRRSAD